LDSQLTDGGEVVSLTNQQPFNPKKIPGTHFRATERLEGLVQLKKRVT
jgi:hypothetical protein